MIGEWSQERYASPVFITSDGRAALATRALYDLEPVEGGLVEPGWQAIPWLEGGNSGPRRIQRRRVKGWRMPVETRLDELGRLSAAVEALGRQDHWSSSLIFQVNLVLEELGLNIINHGHDNGLHEINIVVTSEAQVLLDHLYEGVGCHIPLKPVGQDES